MTLDFYNAGHRGLGCTDNPYYGDKRDIKNLPVENTIPSFDAGYDAGMVYFETDAVTSKDGVIFTVHNVKPADHFFGAEKPEQMLNKMNFADIEKYKTGHYQNGQVSRMEDALALAKRRDPKVLSFCINIEIKGNQGSQQDYEDDDFLINLADLVRKSGIDLSRVLFSSFSLENMIRMSHLLPEAQFGMLFAENPQDGSEPKPKPIYADHRDDPHYQYLPFDPLHVDYVMNQWTLHAHPQTALAYVHPEIMSITPQKIDDMAKHGLGINCWALFEKFDETRAGIYKNTIACANEKKVQFTVITDYLPEMQKLKLAA
jgi:glycerophosphoryl diester phosphodiesterase